MSPGREQQAAGGMPELSGRAGTPAAAIAVAGGDVVYLDRSWWSDMTRWKKQKGRVGMVGS